jgi:stress-induced morphogen
MPVTVVRGATDPIVEAIVAALEAYAADHPASRIDLYRQNNASVRVRIIDPEFEGMSLPDRSRLVWEDYLDSLSDRSHGEITALILLAPKELKRSMSNIEFEDPTPSTL